MKKIVVLLFANLREKAGTNRVELELSDEATIGNLKEQLINTYPILRSHLNNVLFSVNQKIALEEDMLPGEAEVAIFPPVSGGNGFPTIIEITDLPLVLDDVVKMVTLETTGAVCSFTGVVRGMSSIEPVITNILEYEAYKPMAETIMMQIAEEIRNKFPSIEGVALIQRIGRLEVGTPTVIIACSSAHRDNGVFDATRYGIDRLKEIVPIWKKEIGPKGENWVEGEHHAVKL